MPESLTQAREAIGLDQEQAAAKLNMAPSTLCRIERGQTKRIAAMDAILMADLYRLTIQQVLDLHLKATQAHP